MPACMVASYFMSTLNDTSMLQMHLLPRMLHGLQSRRELDKPLMLLDHKHHSMHSKYHRTCCSLQEVRSASNITLPRADFPCQHALWPVISLTTFNNPNMQQMRHLPRTLHVRQAGHELDKPLKLLGMQICHRTFLKQVTYITCIAHICCTLGVQCT